MPICWASSFSIQIHSASSIRSLISCYVALYMLVSVSIFTYCVISGSLGNARICHIRNAPSEYNGE